MMPQHMIHWFEIPTSNYQRAISFYEQLLSVALKPETMQGVEMAVFPYAEQGVSGALVHSQQYQPSAQGTVAYLNANPSLDAVLAKVESLGGKVTWPKTALPEGMGFFAHILDPEGNRIGLHAQS
ncbi:MAG: VOC family protein [Burkholderiales bacterium]|jgi:predicted enzyme related to lactoylglutathione lyase